MDNDLKDRVLLPVKVARRLRQQCEQDAIFLASQNICDYSLLLCVHRKIARVPGVTATTSSSSTSDTIISPPTNNNRTTIQAELMEGPASWQLGIIDWWTTWNYSKKLEHHFKTKMLCLNDRDENGFYGISACAPQTYSQRFVHRVAYQLFPDLTHLVDIVLSSQPDLAITTLDLSECSSVAQVRELVERAIGESLQGNGVNLWLEFDFDGNHHQKLSLNNETNEFFQMMKLDADRKKLIIEKNPSTNNTMSSYGTLRTLKKSS
jgi:hypothetical protein